MSTPGPVKVLLVDDIEENLLALRGLMRRDGLDCLTARSGPEALELLLAHDVALAVLDVQMPVMDGFELAEMMRNSSRTQHIPIIFLTAGGKDDQRRFRGYEAGAVDFLYKPIESAVLQSKADVFIDLYMQRQELVRQRDELKEAWEENNRLYQEILELNETLEERVKERTNQLMEANEHLSGFTHSIAHDFRQYIRNINVNAELVLEAADDSFDEFRPNLERIRRIAKLMNQMTDDLLTYARMRKAPLHRASVDISLLAEEIGESIGSAYPQTQLFVEPELVGCGDQTMLRIVLENLLDNAFKYSQLVKSPKVEVGQSDGGFFIRDNGIGFDMAYAGKVLQPFERLLPESAFGGTGMGLANVKRILDRHNGEIRMDAAPGKGATFWFSLGEPAMAAAASG